MPLGKTVKRALKKPKEWSLRNWNRTYWGKTRRGSISEKSHKAFIRSRKHYFIALRKRIPFFRKILNPKNKKEITVTMNGNPFHFTLLETGIKMKGHSRPIVIVLDMFARRRLFYKSTGMNSGMPGKWLPFNAIEIRRKKGGTPYYLRKFDEHLKLPELSLKLGEEIRKLESSINFMEMDLNNKSDAEMLRALSVYL
ncbi:MAG: hypothetical protein ABIE23_05425 [archaeon]